MAIQQFGNVFIYKKLFDKTRVEDFIHEQIVKPMKDSELYSRSGPSVKDTSFRQSQQCIINDNNPFCKDVAKVVKQINDDFYNMNIFQYNNENHFLKYESGGKFIKHRDVLFDETTVNHISSPIRKITAICLLSDRETFEGGKLATFKNNNRSTYDFDAGDLMVFPSYLEHQVDELTSGIRYSTVHWSHGGF